MFEPNSKGNLVWQIKISWWKSTAERKETGTHQRVNFNCFFFLQETERLLFWHKHLFIKVNQKLYQHKLVFHKARMSRFRDSLWTLILCNFHEGHEKYIRFKLNEPPQQGHDFTIHHCIVLVRDFYLFNKEESQAAVWYKWEKKILCWPQTHAGDRSVQRNRQRVLVFSEILRHCRDCTCLWKTIQGIYRLRF